MKKKFLIVGSGRERWDLPLREEAGDNEHRWKEPGINSWTNSTFPVFLSSICLFNNHPLSTFTVPVGRFRGSEKKLDDVLLQPEGLAGGHKHAVTGMPQC